MDERSLAESPAAICKPSEWWRKGEDSCVFCLCFFVARIGSTAGTMCIMGHRRDAAYAEASKACGSATGGPGRAG